MFWESFGHIVGFGHIFGHIMDTFGENASKMCLSPHRAPAPALHHAITRRREGIIWTKLLVDRLCHFALGFTLEMRLIC